jgi:SAM-dependent methyltransferase
MLKEHLSQAHDAASRRSAIIDHHVQWIHEQLLSGKASHILDITCGPGLYASRLARLGHHCRGIDFSPASIDYARTQAENEGLACEYILDNVVKADFGTGYHLAMMIFGEFNVFAPLDAQAILSKAFAALTSGGILLLEPQTYASIKASGERTPTWFTGENDLFSEKSHITLQDQCWYEEFATTTERYFVIHTETGSVDSFVINRQAYTENSLRNLLQAIGFTDISFYTQLGTDAIAANPDFMAVTARKP